jgi:two-component system, chemotaxis family, protein-glutamate methylesterase/glutaminase
MSIVSEIRPTPAADAHQRRVLLVDDSAAIRGFYRRALESDPSIHVVASVGTGQSALNTLAQQDVDVVVLDIEMPVMDGLTALPRILSARPGVKVLVVSGLTPRGADISYKALVAGAAECVLKPGSDPGAAAEFQRDLVTKVKALADARKTKLGKAAPGPKPETRAPKLAPARHVSTAIRAIAIASSTGGPSALLNLIPMLKDGPKQPIFITQHMPPRFTTSLAEHLSRVAGRPAAEGVDGETVKDGRIYVAPGDWHMTIEGTNPSKIRLTQTPPVNFCRPSADPMLHSLTTIYGSSLLCVVLTGMGSDGLTGATELVHAGGSVIAQDQATSVVWGMPGAVANAGLCSAILPLEGIGSYIRKVAMGGKP